MFIDYITPLKTHIKETTEHYLDWKPVDWFLLDRSIGPKWAIECKYNFVSCITLTVCILPIVERLIEDLLFPHVHIVHHNHRQQAIV